MIIFEFDEEKSKINSAKHGIDFIEAQKLWEDQDLLEIPAKTRYNPDIIFSIGNYS